MLDRVDKGEISLDQLVEIRPDMMVTGDKALKYKNKTRKVFPLDAEAVYPEPTKQEKVSRPDFIGEFGPPMRNPKTMKSKQRR